MTRLFVSRPVLVALVLSLAVLLVLPCVFAQETTAGITGTVKDQSGALITKATVEVSSPALIGVKKMQTDEGGYYRFANLPPGNYTLTVSATGFRSYRQAGITLAVGQLPTIDVTLPVGAVGDTVEVTGTAPLVDVTQSKVQTNISEEVLANVPRGRSFQSVIQFAPGARTEPLQSTANGGTSNQNGYQIGGASNTENSYLVEGQETASAFDGHAAANVPMEFIQEVQVKSSGFEAEYGGALGGVVNVIPKRGGNEWHGSVFFNYEGDAFEAAPNRTLRRNPQTGAAARVDQPAQYYQPKKDHYRYVTPGVEVGGYLLKDRLWVFGSTAPEFDSTARTVNFASPSPVISGAPSATPLGPRTLHYNYNTYYSVARVDFLATEKIRLFGSWSYSYARSTGNTLPAADSAFGQYNPDAGQNVDNYNGDFGAVYPNVIYNTGADITISPNVVSTTRFGLFKFDNGQSRGLATGIRYWYRDTNYNYNTANVPANLVPTNNSAGQPCASNPTDPTCAPGYANTSLNGEHLSQISGGRFVNPTNWSSIGNNNNVWYDAWKSFSFNQDLAYFKKGFGGTHNFKFGYGFKKGENTILSGFNTAQVYVAFDQEYAPNSSNGMDRCLAIETQNLALYGSRGGASDGSSCRGKWGTVNIRDVYDNGKVAGWNHSLYAQDAWTVGRGITLNVGVRLDKESLPSYFQGFKGIDFGWGQKVAPRLGGSWDVLGTGKLKVYGSFGYFYDIMKYQLPRGSFGGDFWRDCVYALDTPDFTTIQPMRNTNGTYSYCPRVANGATGALGNIPSTLRFIENYDFREPSNDPNQPGSLGTTGLVDPNLKPMKQHEMVAGADWALSPTLAFETRYSRKRLDRTIEDSGTITQDGEVYYIVNPGMGINSVQPNCNGCPQNPKANRSYDGVEFRLTKRGAGRWFGALSYTYSRLYGNYSGLTATDISDGQGRNGANTDRAFDEPFMSFDANGKAIDGPLATDRPHTFKAYGYYNFKWRNMETRFGAYQQLYSGTPLSSYISVWGAPVFVEGRGKFVNMTTDAAGNWVPGSVVSKRTPMFSESDFSFVHTMHVSKNNERLMATFEANIFNIFNQHSPTIYQQNLIRTSGINPWRCSVAGANCTPTESTAAGFDYGAMMTQGYNWASLANSQSRYLSSLYGLPYQWQNPRSMRFAMRFTF